MLNTRPRKSAEKYAKIWTAEGSPLQVHTERQANLLRGYLERAKTPHPLVVDWAMRYGTAVDGRRRCAQLQSAGLRPRSWSCRSIRSMPPARPAARSTRCSRQPRRMRNVPELRLVKHFHDHPGYIEALARSVRDYWTANGRPDQLVMSFHGVPRFTLERGDPYHCECQKTGRLLAEALPLEPEQYVVTFQSRFGRAEWLKPYTQDTVEALGRKKTRPHRRDLSRLRVRLPGNPGRDRHREQGRVPERGGGEFHYIPCLNEREDWIEALAAICLRTCRAGWNPAANQPGAAADARRLAPARPRPGRRPLTRAAC